LKRINNVVIIVCYGVVNQNNSSLRNEKYLSILFLNLFTNKMKHNKYHTVGTVLKSNRKNCRNRVNIDLTHICMTAYFLGLVQTLQ